MTEETDHMDMDLDIQEDLTQKYVFPPTSFKAKMPV